jgi:uncharacterized protein involved in copper resistance
MNSFAAYTVALDLVRALGPIVEKLQARAELANQIDHQRRPQRLGKCAATAKTVAASTATRAAAPPRSAAYSLAAALQVELDDQHARTLLDRERGLLCLTHDRKPSDA